MKYDIPGYKRYWMNSDGHIFEGATDARLPSSFGIRNPRVTLTDDRRIKKCLGVHILVATVFVPNPEGFKYVHHLDGDPLNYHPSNLYWWKTSTPRRTT